ncbi:hypothetical protein Syncc8109_1165 [Synechococcus sp. WH 8109]|nr:hypothetical protein Syncc8109_1165 [Synechococcus sp. WH 8109]
MASKAGVSVLSRLRGHFVRFLAWPKTTMKKAGVSLLQSWMGLWLQYTS